MSENKKRFFDEFDYPSYEDWKSAAVSALKGAPFDKLMFTSTYEGIELKPIYTKEDLDSISFAKQDFPGIFPFNRGASSSGYKAEPWEISQIISIPIPEDFNKALKDDLNNGQNSIRLNLEKSLCIHEDFTSDDISGYELLAAQLSDLQKCFDDVSLRDYPVNIDAGVGALPVFAGLCSIAKSQGTLNDLQGTINFDYITELAKEGIVYDNLDRFIDEMYAITSYSINKCPGLRTISIKAYEWHNFGANAVQEAAVAIALGVRYIKDMLHKGMNIDEIANKMTFGLSIGTNFFMEIAKFRALRIIWSRIIKEFGGNELSGKMHIQAFTSEKEISKLDPYVNLLRSTSQVFSAVSANVDSITVHNFDKEFGLPNDFSRRVARNTQNVIKYEAHLDDTIDPVSGSYYIETLTTELIKKIWGEFLVYENAGGIIAVIENNSLQNKININFKKKFENISVRKDVMVGVNKYANITEKPIKSNFNFDITKVDNFVGKFDEYINNRDNSKIDSLLDDFEIHFENEPVKAIDIAIEALKLGAGFAEIYNSVPVKDTEVIGIEPIYLRRTSEEFEILRHKAYDYIQNNGKNPELDFICFGSLRDWKARADFANDFFAVGAFTNRIIDNNLSVEDAINKMNFSDKHYVVICSTDEMYLQIVPDLARKIKEANSESFIILAGYPKDMADEYRKAGVDMFIHVKANILECLNELYDVYGLNN
ncbi:methylmalonyl-CoA mutase family protein [Candidatus Kapaibacterium sp.]